MGPATAVLPNSAPGKLKQAHHQSLVAPETQTSDRSTGECPRRKAARGCAGQQCTSPYPVISDASDASGCVLPCVFQPTTSLGSQPNNPLNPNQQEPDSDQQWHATVCAECPALSKACLGPRWPYSRCKERAPQSASPSWSGCWVCVCICPCAA